MLATSAYTSELFIEGINSMQKLSLSSLMSFTCFKHTQIKCCGPHHRVIAQIIVEYCETNASLQNVND